MDLELGPLSLQQALESGFTMVRERASTHGIELSLQLDPGIGCLQADERKVKQIVFNLLSNAVKFTPDGGRVDVLAHEVAGGVVQVSVRDTGIGIAAEDQERIFEAFQQAGHDATRAREGTGLGLSLAKQFVELHGGHLWVESRPGAGSAFSFTLPMRPAVPPAVPPDVPPDVCPAARTEAAAHGR
jgi:signal transduction histidine kinase